MTITDYFKQIENELYSSPFIASVEFSSEIIDVDIGFFKTKTSFIDNSELHIFEYIEVVDNIATVSKYRYHYQDKKNTLIFRFDNAPHYPELKSFPDHLHLPGKVIASEKPKLKDVLLRIVNLFYS